MKLIPSFLVGLTVFLNEIGRLGTSEKVTLPKVEKIRETGVQGGFERSNDTGIIKAMEAEITFSEYHDSVYRAIGDERPSFVFKGSLKIKNKSVPVVATLKGEIDVDDGEWETGKKIERKLKVFVDYYSLEIDGVEQVMIDIDNVICRIGGVDYFEKLRAHIF